MVEAKRTVRAGYRILKKEGFFSLVQYSFEKIRRREFRILDGSEEIHARNLSVLRKGAPDGYPIPPLDLVRLVTDSIDLERFLRGGRLGVENLNNLLHKNNLDLSGFESILDFGCGCGRIIRHITATGKLFGSDYNREAISWAKDHLRNAEFSVNELLPPTNYSSNTFDFIYAFSVLTHMSEKLGLAWMLEFRRLLKPRGYLMLSLHGDGFVSLMTNGEKKRFRSGYFVVRNEEQIGTNSCAAFHPMNYIRDTLAQGFEIIDFVACGASTFGGQDLLLLQKPKD